MSRHSRITAGNDYTYWAEECRSIKRSNDYWLTTAHPLFCTTPAGGGRSYLTTVNQITGWPPSRHCTVQYYLPFSNWLRMSLAGIRGKPRINDTAPKNKFFSPNNQWNKKNTWNGFIFFLTFWISENPAAFNHLYKFAVSLNQIV